MKFAELCIHDRLEPHPTVYSPGETVNELRCPGGREIEIDYKAAAKELVEWAYETEGVRTAGTAIIVIIDAALGKETNG